MTGFEISNGTTTVKNSPAHSPRCVDVVTHLCERQVEVSASHWPQVGDRREAYISVRVSGQERDYEVPSHERGSYRRLSTEQTTYLDIEDARALRDALTVALDCADVK